MKKAISLCLIFAMLLTVLTGFSYAADGGDGNMPPLGLAPGGDDDENELPLPFRMETPEYVFLDRISENTTVQTLNVAYTMGDSMKDYLSLSSEEKKGVNSGMGFASLKVNAQIDWAIDDPQGWHYDEFWDNEGSDPDGHIVLGDWAMIGIEPEGKKLQSTRIFPDFGDPEDKENTSWNGFGYAQGWKDILSEDLLKLDEEKKQYYIDWTEHTLYIRMRFETVTIDNDEEFMENRYFTEWSAPASFGKDVEEYYPYEKEEDIPIPEVSSPVLQKAGESWILSFNVEIPEEFEENAVRTEVYGGVAHLVSAIRLNESGEPKIIYGDAVSGMVSQKLETLFDANSEFREDMPVEVYCFLWMDQYLGVDGPWVGSLAGAHSKTVGLNTKQTTEPDPTPSVDPVEPTAEPTGEPDVTTEPTPTVIKPTPTVFIPTEVPGVASDKDGGICKVCHLKADPQLFGVCMFIWGGGIIVLIVLIVVITKIIRKKQDEQNDILFR